MAGSVALYGLLVAASYAVLAFAADRAWYGTLLLFGPRWVLLLPGLVLAAAALALGRYWLVGPVALSLFAVAGPIMGFELPSPFADEAPADAARIRVATFNVGQKRLNSPEVHDALRRTAADVIALQEVAIDARPAGRGGSPLDGYEMHCDLANCLLSRFPIVAVRARDRDDVWKRGGSGAMALYDLDGGKLGTIQVLNVHLETARDGLEAIMHERLEGRDEVRANIELRRWESELARTFLRDHGASLDRLVVAGDFNMPVESAIYRSYWADFENAFSSAGVGYGFTKHTRLLAARIDHVLVGGGVRVEDAWVNDEVGSDHRPVVADLVLEPSATAAKTTASAR